MRLWRPQSVRYYLALTAAALALRLAFVCGHPVVDGDTFFYGELARNWVRFGILGVGDGVGATPSLIRLPGYPAFLAALWSVFGINNFLAVLLAQTAVDVATCFVVANLARRLVGSGRAARIAFLLAALCPFTANYAASALTETLAIFFAALALDLAVAAGHRPGLRLWTGCGAAVAAGILMRPDGGILLAALVAYLGLCCLTGQPDATAAPPPARRFAPWLARALVLCLVALAPLAPWTLRNWHDFGLFQPLAPRYANDPSEFVPRGWQTWVKTWIADYVSVAEIYWVEGEETLDLSRLPARAFDTAEERARVAALFAAYNTGERRFTPELDAQFRRLAAERIRRHPVRYYVLLPALRIADMWLRPRTEMLNLAIRWWEFGSPPESLAALLFGLLNLAYLAAACLGAVFLWKRPGSAPGWGMLVIFVVLRSLFLGSLENPEPRYTLECYPVVFVLAAAWLNARFYRPANR
jgi:4-amino-4-deoxy-L-arabinose transferase-like glycosyltransferase